METGVKHSVRILTSELGRTDSSDLRQRPHTPGLMDAGPPSSIPRMAQRAGCRAEPPTGDPCPAGAWFEKAATPKGTKNDKVNRDKDVVKARRHDSEGHADHGKDEPE
ncbi:hypothetical protein MTO96_045913, partial [Rhipicephalus appendiculatus]